jgi:hypothetical protein
LWVRIYSSVIVLLLLLSLWNGQYTLDWLDWFDWEFKGFDKGNDGDVGGVEDTDVGDVGIAEDVGDTGDTGDTGDVGVVEDSEDVEDTEDAGGFCTVLWDSDLIAEGGSETWVGAPWKKKSFKGERTLSSDQIFENYSKYPCCVCVCMTDKKCEWVPQKFQYQDTVQLLNQYADIELQEVLFVWY